ncbi:MAG: TIGR00159 family protein [Bacteroidales bacterium]|nr:TIGR00159 family protein [Bacteroidales bacterium]
MLLLSIISELPSFDFFDFLDIILVGLLLFYVIKLLKGTNAISILIGFLTLFITWKVVSMLGMKILSEILGQFISLGVTALIVIFQPEIRRFLILIGSKSLAQKGKRFFFLKYANQNNDKLKTNAIVQACSHMSATQTGALMIFCRDNKLDNIIASGEVFESELSSQLLETIFFKNTPLHDGAVIIDNGKIKAARCILPVSHANDIPLSMGLRHRSALGVTENSDAIAVVVSEQTGKISIASDGSIRQGVSTQFLQEFLDKEFNHIEKKEEKETKNE